VSLVLKVNHLNQIHLLQSQQLVFNVMARFT